MANALQAISSAVNLIERRAPDAPGALPPIIAATRSALEHARGICRGLLAEGRADAACPELNDVAAVVRRLLPTIGLLAGPRVDVRLAAEPGLGPVVCDGALLERAVLNLVANAVHAMPDGGALGIAVHACAVPALSGPRLVIRVSDQGIGIPESDLPKVFERFYTNRASGEGTGLGLAMVRDFAVAQGGSVSIRSELGRGTEVELALAMCRV